MEDSNYKIFEKQLPEVVKKYPNFTIKLLGKKKFIKGILDVPNDDGNIVGSFLIEVHYKNGFPNKFPKLFEVGGDIPNIAEWHKYEDNSCCITVDADEILKCKHAPSVLSFIENQSVSFLANFIFKKANNFYKNGEFGHGAKGIGEFYESLLKTTDRQLWIEYFEMTFRNKPYNTNRNDMCFCGSNTKFKKCHEIIFYKMNLIGKTQISNDFKQLLILI